MDLDWDFYDTDEDDALADIIRALPRPMRVAILAALEAPHAQLPPVEEHLLSRLHRLPDRVRLVTVANLRLYEDCLDMVQ